jgi:2-oxoglutarate dehydrogenase E1 component
MPEPGPKEPLLSGNVAFLESLFSAWQRDAASVDASWRRYLEAARGPAQAPALLPLEPLALPPENLSPEQREERERRLPHLRAVTLFHELSADDQWVVASIARERTLRAGEVLFREGDAADGIYVLISGALRVERGGKVLALVQPGHVVGEMAVVDGQPRSADVIAHLDTELLLVPAAEFQDLLSRRPAMSRTLLHEVADRLRQASARQEKVDQLVRAYRMRGHAVAQVDPLQRRPEWDEELELSSHGLTEADLDLPFALDMGDGARTLTLREIVRILQATYCRSIGVQYMHIDDHEVRRWLRARMEPVENRRPLDATEQRRILAKLTDAELFEHFLHKKFLGAKRFSLEGGESLIPLLDTAVEEAARLGVEEIVIGMAHRGRLNVLANVMGKSPRLIFEEFRDKDPGRHLGGGGDVKYHMGSSSDRVTACGRSVHLSLCFNPSHLEFVGPVVLGRVRAKQDLHGDEKRSKVLGVIVHGDAAFAGQGVVQEMLNMSGLPGYATGGTLHVIVNNQIGFTTLPEASRSSTYASDLARTLDTPVFHVNGENPEAVAQVVSLALEFRARFSRDVVVDMYCYRRHGHNEGDEPNFTQPVMYKWIAQQPSVRENYLRNLLALGGVTQGEADTISLRCLRRLEEELALAEAPQPVPAAPATKTFWNRFRGGPENATAEVPTAVPRERLAELLGALTRVPDGFHLHPKLQKILEQRADCAQGNRALDWGTAEALAFASLLADGTRVRLSGQDSGRGTFSHRHAVLHDQEDGRPHVPLAHLREGQGRFEVWDSPLSEVAVLGFDWGYSLDAPHALCLWEAQFGDFANVAQVVIDQFVSSAEQKWGRWSGLVLLLPHGFEGQGPEHSSARLERFLSLCANDNLRVVNLTTPAQLFHALRRQVLKPLRKPLVVMSPKSLLRHPDAVSPLQELAEGRYHTVLDDTGSLDRGQVRTVVLCSGKFYYELAKARSDRHVTDVAVVRLEQLYPLPAEEIARVLSAYPSAQHVCWAQEEPANMGAWPFLRLNLESSVLGGRALSCVARAESASPATGSAASHRYEQAMLVDQALT